MAKGIPDILLKIKREKEKEVNNIYKTKKVSLYKNKCALNPSVRSFFGAISQPGMNLIAEFKKASPSKGKIRPGAKLEEVAKLYEKCGASAISVLTDSHFDGKLDFLKRASKAVNLPILRKDFIIDPIQIYESRMYGADAILLISALLNPDQIREYISIANSLKMDCLVESHNKKELEKSIEGQAKIYGINNRNLHDFSVDRNTTLDLLKYVPKRNLIVTESGILNYDHVKKLSDKRVNAMLVGESIMSANLNPTLKDMKNKIYELLGK